MRLFQRLALEQNELAIKPRRSRCEVQRLTTMGKWICRMPWFDRYFTSEWEKRFKKQSYKQFFNDRSLAEEAFQDAWGKLFETLRNTEVDRIPPAKRDPYVCISFKNLLRDIHRKKFGRCRPYAWVQRLGSLWEETALLLCHEDLSIAAMTERLCNDPNHSNDGACGAKVETAIGRLRLTPFCVLTGGDETGSEDFDPVDETLAPYQQLARGDLVSLVETLLALDNAATVESTIVDRIVEQWQEISKQINLSDDERLILKRIYLEDDSITQAAVDLGLKYHTARRLMKGALERIRSVLEQFGIDFKTIVGNRGSVSY